MYFIMMAMGAATLSGCVSGDPSYNGVPDAVSRAFNAEYSGADNLAWENRSVSSASYYRATFRQNGNEVEVWYAPDGTWYMTITEMPYASIPAAVKTSFEGSAYADPAAYQRRDNEVDLVERIGSEPVYIIDVETKVGDVDWDLYYSADGLFVMGVDERGNTTNSNAGGTTTEPPAGSNTAGGDSSTLLPTTPPTTATSVQDAIAQLYPTARIVEIDREYNGWEVDIIDNNRGKEVRLDGTTFAWISTSWEIWPSELPAPVTAYINANHSGYRVDDADYYETATGNYYVIELERGEAERHLRIAPDGTLIS
jgi:hypothetical protein